MDKEKRKQQQREYYYSHKEYFKQKQREWRQNNKEHLKNLKANSYKRNRKKTLETVKKYREKNITNILKHQREKYQKNPKFYKERQMRYKYGITFEDKEKIYHEQEGKCKICLNNFQIHELHIDHNHNTNKIRGLLCPHCNTSLGLLKEDTNILKRAIKYLETNY